jgi:hypothetical protein
MIVGGPGKPCWGFCSCGQSMWAEKSVGSFVGWEDFRAGMILHLLDVDEVAVKVVEDEYVGIAGAGQLEKGAVVGSV